MTNPLLLNLFWGIEKLKNVGPKKASAYEKIGIKNIRDLVFHFPYQAIDRRHSPPLSSVKNGEIITQVVTIGEYKFSISSKKRIPHKIFCYNDSGCLTIVYFNATTKYLKELFILGKTLVISGKVEYNGAELQMIHPDIVADVEKLEYVKKLEPVYHSTYGLNSRFLGITIQNTLRFIPPLPEWIPQDILQKYGWVSWLQSLKKIHYPSHEAEIVGDSIFKQRLAFDEMLAKQLALSLVRMYYRKCGKAPLEFEGTLSNKLTQSLPFALTEGQIKAISEISKEQKSGYRMSRIVLGDVGCGKTLVALYAMLNTAESGKQSALMVPTEILAKQHFENIKKLCEPLGVKVELLISKLSAPIRRSALEAIASNEASIVIGTHALFQEEVKFHDLGLVVIDEQHRFGVEQRKALSQKGLTPDFLMMSATPIPRTLCMVNYGDLDISIIQDKPLMRTGITTSVMSSGKVPEFLNKIKSAIESGQKAYWICPLIDESEALDLSYISERFETLQEILGHDKVGMVHGKMSAFARDEVMLKFLNSEVKVLVATTVIEVGVDVSDATIMIIENAERFGLSQLHQLRGRVGRGSKPSYCVLIYHHPVSEVAKQRLNIMKKYSDGFKIAEEDLKLRGSGDILGRKQSGLPEFKTFNLNDHYHLISEAYRAARNIIQCDSKLVKPEHKFLKLLLELYEQDKVLYNL